MASIDSLKTARMFENNMVYTGQAIRAALERTALTGEYAPAVPARFYDGTEPPNAEVQGQAQEESTMYGCKQEAGGVNPFFAFMAGVLMGTFHGMDSKQ